jgi:hypothetical protein
VAEAPVAGEPVGAGERGLVVCPCRLFLSAFGRGGGGAAPREVGMGLFGHLPGVAGQRPLELLPGPAQERVVDGVGDRFWVGGQLGQDRSPGLTRAT